jgi:hypothetical protein
MEVTAKQAFRHRSLIVSPIGCPKRLIEVLVSQRDERALRSNYGERLRTCRNFSPTVCNSDHLPLLASPARAGTKRIEYTIPTTIKIEGCHVEHQPQVMAEPPTLPVIPESLGKTDPIAVQVSCVHVFISFPIYDLCGSATCERLSCLAHYVLRAYR